MVVLVTGAGGFLGDAVVQCLGGPGVSIVPVRRPGSERQGVTCDLADPEAVCRLLRETEPDCIVNLAAKVDFSSGVLSSLYPVNTLCPAILAAWCKRCDAYLVHASTAVHGRQAGRFGSRDPGHPETDYGVSKWFADQAIAASGCRSAVIRFGGIFGPNGPPHLGVNRAIDQARSGQAPTLLGTGAARRNYIYFKDAAAGIRTCVSGGLTGVFYSGGEIQSIRQMLDAICDVWLPGQRPLVREGEDAADQLIDVSPELGPVRSFRAALEDVR